MGKWGKKAFSLIIAHAEVSIDDVIFLFATHISQKSFFEHGKLRLPYLDPYTSLDIILLYKSISPRISLLSKLSFLFY